MSCITRTRASMPSNTSNTTATTCYKSFASKLHSLLEAADLGGYQDIINWQQGGKSFKVLKPGQFVESILPNHFRQTKFKSFQRQLNIYGFNRLHHGPNKGGYAHPKFVQGTPQLAKLIKRQAEPKSAQPVKKQAVKLCNRRCRSFNSQVKLLPDVSTSTSGLMSLFNADLAQMLSKQQLQLQHQPTPNNTNTMSNEPFRCFRDVDDKQTTSMSSFPDLITRSMLDLMSSEDLSKNMTPSLAAVEPIPCHNTANAPFRLEANTNKVNILPHLSTSIVNLLKKETATPSFDDYPTKKADDYRYQPNAAFPAFQEPISGQSSSSYMGTSNAGFHMDDTDMDMFANIFQDNDMPLVRQSSVTRLMEPNADDIFTLLSNEEENNKTAMSTEPVVEGVAQQNEHTFPYKLFKVLQDVETKDLEHVISWVQGGTAFKVHDAYAFVKLVMPEYFDQTKYESFRRQLNLYGFNRVSRGPNRGLYFHPCFVQADRSLVANITRPKSSRR